MKRESLVSAVARNIVVVAMSFLMSSCYVTEQGSHYLDLIARAIPNTKALADPHISPAIHTLLERVGDVRSFATSELGLKKTKSYTSIVMLDSDRLVTAVSACAELSFDRYLWHYPLIGSFPFRAYFSLQEAQEEEARLKIAGLDAIARPVDAFSTLGWFSDPLFSFMANENEADIADIIIQELTHATIFVKSEGDFDEEISAFVGDEGSILWLESKYGKGTPLVEEVRRDRADATAFYAWLRGTANELQKVYTSDLPTAEKRELKSRIIASRAADFKIEYANHFRTDRYKDFPMARINNAYLDLYRIYEGEPSLYKDYLEKVCGSSMKQFIAEIKRVAKRGGDPRKEMRKELAAVE
jgi:predicted aminopeptidase